MVRLIGIGAVALIIGGCASTDMKQAECRTADWRAIGYEDGRQGRSAGALGNRRKACAGHGVTPDFERYMAGHEVGIAEFCRPQNGYRLGTRGYRYRGVCPDNLESAFLFAHAEGMGLYQRRAAVNRITRQIKRKHKRSRKIEQLIGEKTSALVLAKTPPAQRVSLGVELKQLTEERIDIERAISQLEIDLEHARQDYQAYGDSIATR